MIKTVLHVIDTWGPGGAETVCIDLATGLDRSRFRSIGVAIREGWVFDQMDAKGLAPTIVRTGRGPFDVGFLAGLIRVCRRESPSILQSHLPTANLYSAIAGRLLSIPVVTTFHGTVDFDPSARFARLKALSISRLSGKRVFVSDGLRRQYLATHSAGERGTVVIHNGVDPMFFQPAPDSRLRQLLGLAPQTIIIGAVGNTTRAKGYDALLRVAARLHESGVPVHVVVAGREREPMFGELLRMRSELGLDAVVSFIGFLEDTRLVYSGADIYVSTSVSEGFSLTTVQAMSSGLPVVATRSGGPQEIISNGADGLLFDVGDTTGIAAALTGLAMNPAERMRLGNAARQKVLSHFTNERMAEQYEHVYDALLGS